MGIILLVLVLVFAFVIAKQPMVLSRLQGAIALIGLICLVFLYFNLDVLGAIALGIVAAVSIVMVVLIQLKKVDIRITEREQELFELKEELRASKKTKSKKSDS